jgi:Tfp pilus assembly protein PilV
LDDATGQAGIGGGVSHKQQSKPVQNTKILEKKDKGAWSLQKALQKMRSAKTKEYDNTIKNKK